MNKKIIFIPGWMNLLETYRIYDGLDIWDKRIDYKEKINADYIIGFSIGSCFALANWKENRETKLILVNPIVLKKSARNLIWRYLKYRFFEGKLKNRKVAKGIIKYIKNLFYTVGLINFNVENLINEKIQDNLIVIRGKEDNFFCDNESAIFLRNNNIKLIEIEGVGHNWHEKIDEEIKKIINN